MPGTTGPNLGLTWGYSPGDTGWGLNGFNPGFALLDTVVQMKVSDIAANTPPVSPGNGDRLVVGGSPTGVFAGHSLAVAVYRSLVSAWTFYAPQAGWLTANDVTGLFHFFNGVAWVPLTTADAQAALPKAGGTMTGAFFRKKNETVAAAGTTQGTATVLTNAQIQIVATASANQGVQQSTDETRLINATAVTIKVYPKSGWTIKNSAGALATDAAYSLIANASVTMIEQAAGSILWLV